MVHKCAFCEYTSEKAYNVKRHTIRNHNFEKEQNVQKVVNTWQTVGNSWQTVGNSWQTVGKKKRSYHCSKCSKLFDRESRLASHEQKCKGNPLCCDICKVVFKDKHAKYDHKRNGKCTPVQPPQITNITNNNITNNNITNNNITNNVNVDQSVHINYISFHTKNNEPIEFRTDHIDDPKILKAIFSEPNFLDMFANYTEAVLAAKENQIVQKNNMSRNHAIVYLVDKDTYDYVLDSQVFYKCARGLSTSALVLSDKHRKKAQLSGEHREYLRDIAIDCEASPCSTYDDEDLRYSKRTRDAIHIAKVKTHQQTMKNMSGDKDEDISI